MPGPEKRLRFDLRGVVQGVGFRPYVFDLACAHHLLGHVANNSDGVVVEVQGDPEAVDAFADCLPRQVPPLAFVVEVRVEQLPTLPGLDSFRILPSAPSSQRNVLIAPDVTVCDDCLRELRDPADRRFRYPFINCTHCGPRYTIIHDVPYDRPLTSMARFPMCRACQAEYDDPRDRRFHAQPNACPACGPSVRLCTPDGSPIPCDDPLREAARRLSGGLILAIKGVGGFHLAVDASNQQAVQRLRRRKHREDKPLAIMSRDLGEIARLAVLDDTSRAQLCSRHRPIVLLPKAEPFPLADSVAPGNPHVGIMLPYTPLHAILLDDAPASLVMTSGNVSEEPIAIGNHEALERLGAIADAFVLHDRDILVRNDDSVVSSAAGRSYFLRRSRGYVPLPVMLAREVPCVLAAGAELKNTICLTRGRMAFLSQHVGDQSNLAAFESFQDTIVRLKRILGVEPELVATDLHPDTAPSRWAEECGVPVIAVQHHHAHIAACLAEHQYQNPVIGVALDGIGLGTDGAIWGGELLVADLVGFRRVGHLAYVRLPGGDRASREPWRMAVAHLSHAYGHAWESRLPPTLSAVPAQRRNAVAELVQTGAGSPWTSSAGRLFDAVASLCGLHHESTFEAQAAMALEMAAARLPSADRADRYDCPPTRDSGQILIDPAPLVRQVVQDLLRNVDVPRIASRFHQGFASGIAAACGLAREDTGLSTVALSGGCLQNRILAHGLRARLEESGFLVLSHEKVPPNDGGLSLGQAAVAAWSR